MNESRAFLETVDVFLPGEGETLTEAPAYHWEQAEEIVGRIFRSTRDPNTMLINLAGLTREERRALPKMNFRIDRSGMDFHDFDGFGIHLPGLIVTEQGTAIAVCQRRHDSMGDAGHDSDIIASRSDDGGKTWERQKVIFEEPDCTAIPGPIFETRGAVFVAFWKMPAQVMYDLEYFAAYARQGGGFWLIKSVDEGRNWSEPFFVKPEPNDEGWVAWPNNCVHGIELKSGPHAGRLVMPALAYKEGEPGQIPGVRGGLLYSDDGGESWKAGGVLPDGSDEVSLVEVEGGLYINHRANTAFTGKRHFARSDDGGESFCELGEHDDLPDQKKHCGLIRCEEGLLFSHPTATGPARDMTIYLSRDGGRTWPISRLLHRGPSRYSDLAVNADGSILCIYTHGRTRDREKMSVARFNMDWIISQG